MISCLGILLFRNIARWFLMTGDNYWTPGGGGGDYLYSFYAY